MISEKKKNSFLSTQKQLTPEQATTTIYKQSFLRVNWNRLDTLKFIVVKAGFTNVQNLSFQFTAVSMDFGILSQRNALITWILNLWIYILFNESTRSVDSLDSWSILDFSKVIQNSSLDIFWEIWQRFNTMKTVNINYT